MDIIDILSLILIGCFLALIVGLIKPSLVIWWMKEKKRWKVVGIYGLMIILLFVIERNLVPASVFEERSAEQQIQAAIEEANKPNPKRDLEITNQEVEFRPNAPKIFSFNVENKSSTFTYKDVEFAIDFIAKSRTILETKVYTEYDIFAPGSKKSITFRSTYPAQSVDFNIRVNKAVNP